MTTIRFSSYSPGPERILSNFAECTLVYELGASFPDRVPHDAEVWRSAEHLYQARKTVCVRERALIRAARTPLDAKRASRNITLVPNWLLIRTDVMRFVLRTKFEQCAPFRAYLLSTGNAELVENVKSDAFWGCGRDGRGMNTLGKLLMELRDE